MNINIIYVPQTLRYGIECDAYRVKKIFPKNYETCMEIVHREAGSYYTPFPVKAFEEGFDWGSDEDYTGLMILTAYKRSEFEMRPLETLVLENVHVFIMNSNGATIDKVRI